jgi:Fic family protein
LLRAEAVASSQIEGLVVGARRLALADASSSRLKSDDRIALEVLSNVAALQEAINSAQLGNELDVAAICDIHRVVMAGSHDAGQIRTEQNWIGGNGFNPCSAEYVPPPAELVSGLLEDLCAFAQRDDLPSVVQAAIVHAQFESIHPFADGNGRTGRALIHVVLKRRGTASFVPPISLALGARGRHYTDALNSLRFDGVPDSDLANSARTAWLDFFGAAVRSAVVDADRLRTQLQDLERRWRELVPARAGSAIDNLLARLVSHPVISVSEVATEVGVSFQAANSAVSRLVEAGILTGSGSTRNRFFEAREVYGIITDYERAAATPGGDTKAHKPGIVVPARREN